MPSDREKLEVESLAAVADRMSNAEPDSRAHTVALAEFTRRQTLAQLQATQAQIDAANAAKGNRNIHSAKCEVSPLVCDRSRFLICALADSYCGWTLVKIGNAPRVRLGAATVG
jgi:hypothetical protein